jgi:hypothetical protein
VYAYLAEHSAGTQLLGNFQQFHDALQVRRAPSHPPHSLPGCADHAPLQPFKLTKSEILQICNNRPSQIVELYLIIEACEERLDEAQLELLLAAIEKHLGTPQQQS